MKSFLNFFEIVMPHSPMESYRRSGRGVGENLIPACRTDRGRFYKS